MLEIMENSKYKITITFVMVIFLNTEEPQKRYHLLPLNPDYVATTSLSLTMLRPEGDITRFEMDLVLRRVPPGCIQGELCTII